MLIVLDGYIQQSLSKEKIQPYETNKSTQKYQLLFGNKKIKGAIKYI